MDYEHLLAKNIGCPAVEIDRVREAYHGMAVLEREGATWAVGAPGFTENYYGPELVLSPDVSAYRLTPEGVRG